MVFVQNSCKLKADKLLPSNRCQLWEVKCLKEGQKSFLLSLNSKGAICIQKEEEDRESMEVIVECTRSLIIKRMLQDRNIPFQVLTAKNPSIAPLYRTMRRITEPIRRNSSTVLKRRGNNTMGWEDYYPLQVIYSFLDSLEKEFPATCTVSVIGRTCEGRDMKMLKISNSNAKNTGVWIDATTHAREWISTSVCTFVANYVARNFHRLPANMTDKDCYNIQANLMWGFVMNNTTVGVGCTYYIDYRYFLPVVNPDGYHHSHVADRMWRKTRARFGNTIVGVDINRNFGYKWSHNGSDCSSGDPNHNNFRGTSAFSEPEAAAIKDVILYSGTPFKIFLTLHSFSEVISFPWCHTADTCPDYVPLLEGATLMAKAIYQTHGRMYKVGNFKDIMYLAAGTSIDWSYGSAKIPFSYLIELPSKQHKFLLPKEEIFNCCSEVLSAVKSLVEFVDTQKCTNCAVFGKKLR